MLKVKIFVNTMYKRVKTLKEMQEDELKILKEFEEKVKDEEYLKKLQKQE